MTSNSGPGKRAKKVLPVGGEGADDGITISDRTQTRKDVTHKVPDLKRILGMISLEEAGWAWRDTRDWTK